MRFSFEQLKELFGRSSAEPGDTLSVNGVEYEVESVDAAGAVFVEASDDDDGDDGDDEEK